MLERNDIELIRLVKSRYKNDKDVIVLIELLEELDSLYEDVLEDYYAATMLGANV